MIPARDLGAFWAAILKQKKGKFKIGDFSHLFAIFGRIRFFPRAIWGHSARNAPRDLGTPPARSRLTPTVAANCKERAGRESVKEAKTEKKATKHKKANKPKKEKKGRTEGGADCGRHLVRRPVGLPARRLRCADRRSPA